MENNAMLIITIEMLLENHEKTYLLLLHGQAVLYFLDQILQMKRILRSVRNMMLCNLVQKVYPFRGSYENGNHDTLKYHTDS